MDRITVLFLFHLLTSALCVTLIEYVLDNGDACYQSLEASDQSKCYTFPSGNPAAMVTWNEIPNACANNGGISKPIRTQIEQDTIVAAINRTQSTDNVWLPGFVYRANWTWIENENDLEEADSRWFTNHPFADTSNRDCAAVVPSSSWELFSWACSLNSIGYICQKDSNAGCATENYFDLEFNTSNRCFYLSEEMFSFYKARESCSQFNMTLVSVDTQEVYDRLNSLSGYSFGNFYWIGLTRARWYWRLANDTFEEILSTFWREGQPDLFGTTCLTIQQFGEFLWASAECTENYRYFCEVDVPSLPEPSITSSSSAAFTSFASVAESSSISSTLSSDPTSLVMEAFTSSSDFLSSSYVMDTIISSSSEDRVTSILLEDIFTSSSLSSSPEMFTTVLSEEEEVSTPFFSSSSDFSSPTIPVESSSSSLEEMFTSSSSKNMFSSSIISSSSDFSSSFTSMVETSSFVESSYSFIESSSLIPTNDFSSCVSSLVESTSSMVSSSSSTEISSSDDILTTSTLEESSFTGTSSSSSIIPTLSSVEEIVITPLQETTMKATTTSTESTTTTTQETTTTTTRSTTTASPTTSTAEFLPLIPDCSPGYIVDTTFSLTEYRCLILPSGFYTAESASTRCSRCPTGRITNSRGSTSVSECAEREDVRSGVYFRTVLRFPHVRFIPEMNEQTTEEVCVYGAFIDNVLISNAFRDFHGFIGSSPIAWGNSSLLAYLDLYFPETAIDVVNSDEIVRQINENADAFTESDLGNIFSVDTEFTQVVQVFRLKDDTDSVDFKTTALIAGTTLPAIILLCLACALIYRVRRDRSLEDSDTDAGSSVRTTRYPFLRLDTHAPWMNRAAYWAPYWSGYQHISGYGHGYPADYLS